MGREFVRAITFEDISDEAKQMFLSQHSSAAPPAYIGDVDIPCVSLCVFGSRKPRDISRSDLRVLVVLDWSALSHR